MSYGSSATLQTIHMKYQDIFYENKIKEMEMSSAAVAL